MITFNFIITDKLGIHARPAGLLVKIASKFSSHINITNGNKTADAKKLFAVMSLCVKCGDKISICINGDDEKEAEAALCTFLNENL